MFLYFLLSVGLLMGNEGFTLTSSAFTSKGSIPSIYTCQSQNISPPLTWENPPSGTQSFALIVDDPDAKSLVTHWLVYNIPKEDRSFQENNLPSHVLQGKNSSGNAKYMGPCPPQGTHRYFFKLYALDSFLSLPAGVSREELEKAMENHILEKTELMGTYKKN